jgi:hypothetical protein
MTEGTKDQEFARSETFISQYTTQASMTSNLIDETVKNFPRRLARADAIMTGAGGAGDTVKLQRVSGGSAVDITDAVDVSGKADKTFFNFGTFDDAQLDFGNGDNLRIVTASDALCRITLTWLILQATP